MFKLKREREYEVQDVLLIAARHQGVDTYVFQYYVMYIKEFELRESYRVLNSTAKTGHEFATSILRGDGWQPLQIHPCAEAYAKVEKFLSETKAQGLKHKERR